MINSLYTALHAAAENDCHSKTDKVSEINPRMYALFYFFNKSVRVRAF